MAPVFDPFKQNITFHFADGSPFDVPVAELDYFIKVNTTNSINYGAQVGASVVVAILLALLTAPDKRRSPVFALNMAAVLLNTGRMLSMSIYFTSSFSEVYSYFAGDYSRVSASAYANSVLGVVLTTLLLVCIEISLVVQTQVVCTTLRDMHRYILLAVSTLVALVPIGFRMAMMVENCKSIVTAIDFSPWIWLQSATNITVAISICYFSMIFVTKLGYAIHSRKRLGLTGFGAMQVIFVMSCQSLVVPGSFPIIYQ